MHVVCRVLCRAALPNGHSRDEQGHGTSRQQQVFLQYMFTDVMVESVQWSGSTGGDDTPTESLSLAFAKVAIYYSKQDEATGAMSAAGNASWDLTKVRSKPRQARSQARRKRSPRGDHLPAGRRCAGCWIPSRSEDTATVR